MLKVTGVAEENKSSLEIPKKFQRQRVSPLSASAAASFPKELKLDLGCWQKLVFSPKEETAIRGPEHWAQQCKPRQEEARIFTIFMSVHGYILKPFTKKLVSLGKIS